MEPTASTGHGVQASDTKHMQVSRDESKDAMDQDLPELAKLQAKPKAKPKARPKKRRMVNELGNHNESPEPASDGGSPEILLEGFHRTRAARQNLNYAVTNRAAPARKSLNTRALMMEVLKGKAPEVTKPGQKKDVKRKSKDNDPDEGLNDIEYVKTRSRRGKKVPQLGDKDEEMEEADDAFNVNVKEQQKRKASQMETSDAEMEETVVAVVIEPKATGRPKRKKILKLKPSRDEDSDQEDEDFLPAEANPDDEAPVTKQRRRSSRLDCANATATAFGTDQSAPRLLTSGMAWDHKKGPTPCVASCCE